jgi:hypothetical protein
VGQDSRRRRLGSKPPEEVCWSCFLEYYGNWMSRKERQELRRKRLRKSWPLWVELALVWIVLWERKSRELEIISRFLPRSIPPFAGEGE